MYDNRSNLIIGFHGCDRAAAAALINNPDTIKFSKEPHDWLGHGMYFWENNQERAKQWAVERQLRRKKDVVEAAVIGAVIQLGYCCDLMDSRFTSVLKNYYPLMIDWYNKMGNQLPARAFFCRVGRSNFCQPRERREIYGRARPVVAV